ncbi:hypothetical protein GMLC_02550 [Geomonas limicola]|uniref:Uncharacterized protein n=2 Tax=Geomonas limicola TaxID=2740186 RepID=A0A6V8N2G6_9BACT|nr:hypothetical protein GMLC_02550 [Geomonas limicola]
MAANAFLGYTLFNAIAAAVIAKTFLEQRRPGLLMMGCGAIIWNCSGLVGTVSGLGLFRETVDINSLITMHNCCLWGSSFCHLAGAGLSPKWQLSEGNGRAALATTYLLAGAVAGLIVVLAYSGGLPVFFIAGKGGTMVRQFVLGSAVAMLALAALILLWLNRSASSALRWYPPALMLLAIGVTGVLVQKVNGGWVGWLGRGTQSLGGFYLVIGALVSHMVPLPEGVPFWRALTEMRQKWAISAAIAAVLVCMGAAARLLLLPYLGGNFP